MKEIISCERCAAKVVFEHIGPWPYIYYYVDLSFDYSPQKMNCLFDIFIECRHQLLCIAIVAKTRY